MDIYSRVSIGRTKDESQQYQKNIRFARNKRTFLYTWWLSYPFVNICSHISLHTVTRKTPANPWQWCAFKTCQFHEKWFSLIYVWKKSIITYISDEIKCSLAQSVFNKKVNYPVLFWTKWQRMWVGLNLTLHFQKLTKYEILIYLFILW